MGKIYTALEKANSEKSGIKTINDFKNKKESVYSSFNNPTASKANLTSSVEAPF